MPRFHFRDAAIPLSRVRRPMRDADPSSATLGAATVALLPGAPASYELRPAGAHTAVVRRAVESNDGLLSAIGEGIGEAAGGVAKFIGGAAQGTANAIGAAGGEGTNLLGAVAGGANAIGAHLDATGGESDEGDDGDEAGGDGGFSTGDALPRDPRIVAMNRAHRRLWKIT